MDVVNFLREFVNNTEDTKKLITLFLNRSGCRFGALFLKKNNTMYELIDHVSQEHKDQDVAIFTPCKPISSVFISTDGKKSCGYKSSYTINNIMIIPVTVCNDDVGVICIGNKDIPFVEEDIDQFNDLISLTQFIINKCKLIGDYKKIYSDSTYFSKDLFLANMSHEIITPLNGIIGYNQLLMNTELNKTQKNYLLSASQCSIQLMQIINDIIDFSKLSTGKMKVNNECFSITEIFSSIENTMRERIKLNKHRCSFVINPDVPEYVIMDKQKLIQIVINLLSNSINYTPPGGNITITVKNTDNTLNISVTDDGVGISEQDQCKLFNSFSQIHNSLTKTGTGLGLAISKRLVELLGGEINVNSILVIGSTFYFSASHQPIDEYEKDLENNSKILFNKTILVVDDNPDNRIIIGELLFEWKMRPIICASAKEALKLISGDRYEFELGLIDICMPEITGVDLAEQIKQIKPLFPLIALSSSSEFVDVTNFEAKLNKPLNKLQLFNSIHKIINQNQKDTAYIGSDKPSTPPKKLSSPILSPKELFNSKTKILIAEDILYNQTLLENMVKALGYTDITTASDGEETIQKVDLAHEINSPFVVLLLDLRMPKMDGYDVINHIRNMGYPLPKIVAVTASVLDEDRKRCKDMGVQYFINKPIDMNQLKNVLLRITYTTTNH